MEGILVLIMEVGLVGFFVIFIIYVGILDVIIYNEIGLFCEEYDVVLMVKYMIQILDNFFLVKGFGVNNKKRIIEYFSFDKYFFIV